MPLSASQRTLFFVSSADSKYCLFSKLRMKLEDRSWSTIQRYECQRFEITVHCPWPHDR